MSGQRSPVNNRRSSHSSLQEPRADSEARSTSLEAKAQELSHLTVPSIRLTLDDDDLDRSVVASPPYDVSRDDASSSPSKTPDHGL